VPEAAVTTLWSDLSERNARALLTKFERRCLLLLDGQRRMSFHDLQHAFLCHAHGNCLTPLHNELLDAYRRRCPDGWHEGPNDGYFFQQLVYHLIHSERADELHRLLHDFRWLQAKLQATDIIQTAEDYKQWLMTLGLSV
jgi:hypothetical protein